MENHARPMPWGPAASPSETRTMVLGRIPRGASKGAGADVPLLPPRAPLSSGQSSARKLDDSGEPRGACAMGDGAAGEAKVPSPSGPLASTSSPGRRKVAHAGNSLVWEAGTSLAVVRDSWSTFPPASSGSVLRRRAQMSVSVLETETTSVSSLPFELAEEETEEAPQGRSSMGGLGGRSPCCARGLSESSEGLQESSRAAFVVIASTT
mmetsp:Transcript_59538/g.194213  ORF Transcript_59538/g.194213 Transcript_59538/m.194213 type:complete len:209 (-) Transcript_59538:3303-3929(-)